MAPRICQGHQSTKVRMSDGHVSDREPSQMRCSSNTADCSHVIYTHRSLPIAVQSHCLLDIQDPDSHAKI